MKVEMTIPTNYAAVVEAIANDQVDIAYLGGFTYVQASKRAGVIPLVQRDQDQNFHSLFITHPDSGINSLSDLGGHTFAFGDVNSTSGHLMPEYFMREAKVDAEVIAKATYTGGHDGTALAVANKRVDAGALDVYTTAIQMKKIALTFLALALSTGGILSWFASSYPDGLEWAIQKVYGKSDLPDHKKGVAALLKAIQAKTAVLADYSLQKKGLAGSAQAAKNQGNGWPNVGAGSSVSGILGSAMILFIIFLVGFGIKAVLSLAGRDVGEIPAVVNPERRAQAEQAFGRAHMELFRRNRTRTGEGAISRRSSFWEEGDDAPWRPGAP